MSAAQETLPVTDQMPSHFRLLHLVAEMREAQRRYFHTRSQANLMASKALERQVDVAIGKILNPAADFFA